ncbi:MAG: hypothetical protein GX442_15310 [Candidatus Riflebacteria bacterium]|nr:hypothetical protein [Candidatus Riflebacteria bacterium]
MPRKHLSLLLAVAFAILPLAALADGDSRLATPAEREYGLKILGQLDRSLPAIPEGWTTTDRTTVTAWERLSTGVGKDPLGVEFRLEALDAEKIAEAEQKGSKIVEEVALARGDEQKRTADAVQKSLDALTKKMEEAIAKGDTAAMERLAKEAEAAAAPAQSLGDSMNKELKEKMQAVKARDARLQAFLRVNAWDTPVAGFTAEGPVAGHPAFWQENPPDHEGDYEGEWLVFAGAWKGIDQDGTPTMTPAWNLALPHTTAQNLLVRVRGDKTRARAFLEAMQWEGLDGLFPGR